MDLRQLQTLLVVAQTGSLKKAAARLRLVETALSRQIRLLEVELRTKLFERHGRGLTPTEAGQHLVDRTRPILEELERIKAEMLAAHDVVAGKVSIGMPWLLLETLSTRLATGFVPHHPAVRIRFVTDLSNELHRMLVAGDIDIALSFDLPHTQELDVESLFSERLLLIGDRACGYQLDQPVPFAHLAQVPLAMPEPGNSFREKLEALARDMGITLNVRFEVSALQPLKALAANGLANVFASLHAVRAELESGQLTGAPVTGPAITRTLRLGQLRDRPRSAAIQRLAKVVRDEIGTLVSDGSFLTTRTT
jgi:LysR family transcriptional regulator, nitrogen assimilation regulatory protein